MIPPLWWTWRDLGRAIKAARWAYHHADDLTMLKHELESPALGTEPDYAVRQRKWLAHRFLGTLPIQ